MSCVGVKAAAQEGMSSAAATPEEIEGNTLDRVEKLPEEWTRDDDLAIFFVDKRDGGLSKCIKVYAIDTDNASIYHVVDFPSSGDDEDIGNLMSIGVVAYGTKIYAVGSDSRPEGEGARTWIYDIKDRHGWCEGPKLSKKFRRPILFTLDRHLYVLESVLEAVLGDPPWGESVLGEPHWRAFEVLDLEAGDGGKSWKSLRSFLLLDSDAEVAAVAIDKEAQRVYCRITLIDRMADSQWYVYEVQKNRWEDGENKGYWRYCDPHGQEKEKSGENDIKNRNKINKKHKIKNHNLHDLPRDRFYRNLELLPDLQFCSILDSQILIFRAPTNEMNWIFEGHEKGFGILERFNLSSGEKQVEMKGLKCPIEIRYEHFEYFVVHLKQRGDICLVSFFIDPSTCCIGKLVVCLIKKSGKRKNKKVISCTRTYNGVKLDYAARYLQQPSQLGRTSP